MKFLKLLSLLLLMLASCTKQNEPSLNSDKHPITIATRSGDTEATYPHAVLLFRNAATATDVAAIELQQKANAAALQPLSLTNGNYTLGTLAYSSPANLTITPALAVGSTLETTLTVGSGTVPDILFATQPFSVTQAATITTELKRIVGRTTITLTNVPTTPAIQSAQLTIGELSDRVTLDGIYTASNNQLQGTQRTLPLTLKAGSNDTYVSALTTLMPSLPGTTALPLTLTITYADLSTTTKEITLAGTIRPGYTSTITLNYTQSKTLQTLAITYAPWQTNSYFADVEINDTSTPPPASNIGTLEQGGIVCTPNLILALSENPTAIQWGHPITPVAIGLNSTDGATNYTDFVTYAEGNPVTRWERHPVFLYIKNLREADPAPWYLPSKEEWAAVAPNLTTLNAALTANGKTPINGAESYWTSSEDGTISAFSILPGTSTSTSEIKTMLHRVRAIKKR